MVTGMSRLADSGVTASTAERSGPEGWSPWRRTTTTSHATALRLPRVGRPRAVGGSFSCRDTGAPRKKDRHVTRPPAACSYARVAGPVRTTVRLSSLALTLGTRTEQTDAGEEDVAGTSIQINKGA